MAAALVQPGEAAPWQALSQTGISGLRRWDGTPYTVLPDVFVYRQPVDDRRVILALGEVGPPPLVIEILSRTTYESDLDLRYGKVHSYAQAGVLEFLVLDRTGDYLLKQGQGWRLQGGVYVPWLPEATGGWQSRELGAGVGFEGLHVVVYDQTGQRQLREGEVAQELARQRDKIVHRDEEIAALRRLIEQLRQQ